MAIVKFSSNHLLLILLTLALFPSDNLCTAKSASDGRTGGRMGGSSFSSGSPPSNPHISSPFSSSSGFSDRHSTRPCSWRNEQKDETPSGNNSPNETNVAGLLIFGVMVLIFLVLFICGDSSNEASVIMLQVGLSGNASSLQRDLNQIAKTADTSKVEGFHCVLKETMFALLRHNDHWISGYSYVDKNSSVEGSEKFFEQLSEQEREKIDIESLVNFNNVKLKETSSQKANKQRKHYIVVTTIVAARGSYKFPAIKSAESLKSVLQSLSSIKVNNTLAVEVLWTPQDEGDMLSEDELLENYHRLRPI
ncbi:hypothetical protein UlMin_009282 [Ulmus minor]